MTRVEFYRQGGGLLVSVDDGAVPRAGEYVNIARKTWRVAVVSWAVDQPGGMLKPRLRANVEMVETDESGRAKRDRK